MNDSFGQTGGTATVHNIKQVIVIDRNTFGIQVTGFGFQILVILKTAFPRRYATVGYIRLTCSKFHLFVEFCKLCDFRSKGLGIFECRRAVNKKAIVIPETITECGSGFALFRV